MPNLISPLIIISTILITIRFFLAQNTYEKILSFYFIFTHISILILLNSITNFDAILDIVIILFLLQLVVVLFLLFDKKNS